ncbi:2,4-dienoyl-CoA reductase [Streptoalloteichus tenebrarius]|uniref:2,4-dienoyl-CoA reductase n=1 Tax=Streptoalloteichus tenebrarius (strain ATCC 17920 / DSM 40477 / JCM 4838 / CBS 697.72 / NBRC 16177 / NCIMB 11028 / NRRL B-12390 / A12253. 1 / ISP 5477) TaxID=1933 RepID=A0ABT1I0C0_STRSD|nr:NADH:flavin oxidoreductase/NADH oxidase [Streptoalloteichus tenebrarius]MCP2261050.1 2,4-dienoyl-CoA reductase [Streptoalloteichus tenebrarius]BFF03156.1 NADH:flavin oxidoreductase/NADH oxidase [Streptoalloteichus tenebrarius]
MSALFEPITLRDLTIPNRVWMSPMCQYSAAHDGPMAGVPHDWHLAHLASRAVGGVGLAMVEATAVSPEGRITPGDLGLWNDTQRDALRAVAAMLESHGVVPGIQLGHAGRKASTRAPWDDGGSALRPEEGGWRTVAPSAVPYGSFPTPDELDRDGIVRVVADFRAAARRALDAGFKVVELHGAHGYLIHSFLSPHSNHRTDEYGGSFDNRVRFPLEVVDAVRGVWPEDLPVLFRVSATDWLSENEDDGREGWTGEDTVRLAERLQAHGVDLLDTSTGGIAPDARIPVGPHYQTPFATMVRERVGLPVGAVGLITDPKEAEQVVATGQADVVLLGRELLRDPYWPRRAALLLDGDAGWPRQYGWAI